MEDFEIFKGKNYRDLMKDIYNNSISKDKQIRLLIVDIQKLIHNVNDVTLLAPIIKECLEVGVKNDEQLIKLAAIVQRIVAAKSKGASGSELMLTDDEIKELLEASKAEESDTKKLSTATKKVNSMKEKPNYNFDIDMDSDDVNLI